MIFRTRQRSGFNKPIPDLAGYIQQQLIDRPDTKIYLGIDSKVSADHCTYILVIAFRYGSNGVHYIFSKEQTEMPNTKWQRLMNEIERLMNFVSWFKDNLPYTIYAVDVDVNADERHFSNKLHSLATGWGHSLGVNVITKPEEVVASRAADWLLNH